MLSISSTTKVIFLVTFPIVILISEIPAFNASTFDRYKDGVEEHETIKQDISIIKNVVTEHSEKLHKIS